MLWCGHHDYKVYSVTGNLDIKWDSGREIPLIYPFFFFSVTIVECWELEMTSVLDCGISIRLGGVYTCQGHFVLSHSNKIKQSLCFSFLQGEPPRLEGR